MRHIFLTANSQSKHSFKKNKKIWKFS